MTLQQIATVFWLTVGLAIAVLIGGGKLPRGAFQWTATAILLGGWLAAAAGMLYSPLVKKPSRRAPGALIASFAAALPLVGGLLFVVLSR